MSDVKERDAFAKGTADTKKILFQMTGSIACYKACQVISRLVQAGHEVQVVASESALKFVGEATLEGLSGRAVVSDLYGRGNMMDHIHLVRWADLILTAPATANFINKISQGVGDDLLTTQFLAHDFKKPWLIAPAMNTMMYLHPVTQASIQKLRDMGVGILEAASGVLACGEVGWGRLLEPDLIVQEVKNALNQKLEPAVSVNLTPMKAKKVLITSGGTQEPIDEVRAITNHSTGATGAAIADQLTAMGFDVVYLHATTAKKPASTVTLDSFTSFESLQGKLKTHLSSGDVAAVIHAAAVSDFSVASVIENGKSHPADPEGKISSDAEIVLTMKKNPKLISQLRDFAKNPSLKVVGFKMTATNSANEQLTAVKKVFSAARCDLVIHNDTHEMNPALGKHPYHAFTPDLEKKNIENKNELGLFIAQYLMAKGI